MNNIALTVFNKIVKYLQFCIPYTSRNLLILCGRLNPTRHCPALDLCILYLQAFHNFNDVKSYLFKFNLLIRLFFKRMCKSSYLFHVKSWVQGKFQQHRIVHAPLAIYVVSAYETSNPHHSQILSQRRACNRVHGCTITNIIPCISLNKYDFMYFVSCWPAWSLKARMKAN